MDLSAEGLSFQKLCSQLHMVVEDVILASLHGVGDRQELLHQGGLPSLDALMGVEGLEMLFLYVGP